MVRMFVMARNRPRSGFLGLHLHFPPLRQVEGGFIRQGFDLFVFKSINNDIQRQAQLAAAGRDAALHTGRPGWTDHADLQVSVIREKRQRLDVPNHAGWTGRNAALCQAFQIFGQQALPFDRLVQRAPVLGERVRFQVQLSHGSIAAISSGDKSCRSVWNRPACGLTSWAVWRAKAISSGEARSHLETSTRSACSMVEVISGVITSYRNPRRSGSRMAIFRMLSSGAP